MEGLKESTARLKYYESNNTFYGHFDTRVILESQIRELEQKNRNLSDYKQETEVNYRLLIERHNETVKKLNLADNELNQLQNNEKTWEIQINALEDKLVSITKNLEIIQSENKSLKINEFKHSEEKHKWDSEREKYRDKYEKYKSKFMKVSERCQEVFLCIKN